MGDDRADQCAPLTPNPITSFEPCKSLKEDHMSLVGTLAKVALGVAAAKGVSMVVAQAAQPTSMKEPDSQPRQGDTLSSVVGGKGQAGGGLGSLLEQLAMAAGAGGSSGSGATASAPTEGLDALIKGPGAATKGTINKAPVEGSFAEVTDQSFQRSGEPKISPTPQQDAVAGLMLSAMLQAAKCDGRIDEAEQKKILEALGDASREDIAFVNRELSSPVDVQALVDQVPKGLENQIYAISVLGIDLDSQKEAEYLAALGSALGIGSREANAIHAKLGVSARFS
jgi:uncharacterized membrane protein YebE (DUF533 family)